MNGDARIKPSVDFDNSQSKPVKISSKKIIYMAGRFGVMFYGTKYFWIICRLSSCLR